MKMKSIKRALCAALCVAIFGSVQSAHAQIFGRLFGVGQCSSGQCYGGSCYGGSCYGSQCYGGQCYGRTCANGQCANGKCSLTSSVEKASSYESSIATKFERESAEIESTEPTPLGEDWDPLELEKSAPTCSPCQPVQTICEAPVKKRPIVEGIKAAANAVAENAYLARVNRVRAQYGRAPLVIDSTLDAQCAASCKNMAAAGYIYHAPNCGAEIVASNSSRGIDSALNQWLWSSAHAQYLLNANFTRCGVQTYVDSRGRNYCAMRFR